MRTQSTAADRIRPKAFRWLAFATLILALAGCVTPQPKPQTRPQTTPAPVPAPRAERPDPQPDPQPDPADDEPPVPVYQRGEASYYASFFQGRETASGELFDSRELTAAHPKLPMGTRIRVTNIDNGRSVIVRVNDRGPYADDRIVDLSRRAARKLRMIEDGVTDVKLQILERR